MKEIKLTQDKVALVDDEDYDYLMQWKWHILNQTHSSYAVRNEIINGKRQSIRMHRIIMNTPKGVEVDHVDRNGLNNQKSNLRNCTSTQNKCNSQYKLPKSGFIGVHTHKNGHIMAYISVKNKQIHLGCFKTIELAAKARDEAAIKYRGEFANLNFK